MKRLVALAVVPLLAVCAPVQDENVATGPAEDPAIAVLGFHPPSFYDLAWDPAADSATAAPATSCT